MVQGQSVLFSPDCCCRHSSLFTKFKVYVPQIKMTDVSYLVNAWLIALQAPSPKKNKKPNIT